MCASGWMEKDYQHKLQRVTLPLVQGLFVPMAEGKPHQRQLQPVASTMGASGVRALVDGRITPQAQGAKVRAQGAKVRTFAPCALTFAPCACGVILPSTSARTPLAPMVLATGCNWRWCGFPSAIGTKSPCTSGSVTRCNLCW